MADTSEQFYGSEDVNPRLDSPGMQKVNHLSTNTIEPDEPEVTVNFVTRPISSGSAEVRAFTYGTPPKRALQIPKKQAASLYPTSKSELQGNPNTNQAGKAHALDGQIVDRR